MRSAFSKIWVLALPLVLSGCAGPTEPGKLLDVGESFPAFKLQTPEGKSISSDTDLRQKPYVLAVFATWCPPCKQELSSLEKTVWQPLKEKNIAVLGVNFGDESAVDISQFAQNNAISFPLLEDQAGTLRRQLGVESIPVSFVVGADGKIIARHEGFTEDSVAEIGKELLAATTGENR